MDQTNPQQAGWRMPPEWAPQDWLWIGFPHAADEWPDSLPRAQEQIAGFANAVAASGQEVRLLVRDVANAARARSLVTGAVQLEQREYGDIWLRDTGPLVLADRAGTGKRKAMRFGFNGWGGKFEMAGDRTIGARMAADAGLVTEHADWILEGGAIDGDGTGSCITTEQCLLNPNRNPGLSRAQIEERLRRDLGFTRIVWLGEGLQNDHTDGHVDNLARFVGPGRVAIPEAADASDPNAAAYRDARERARAAGLEVAAMPSPGLVGLDDAAEPASYMNFAITSRLVVVPVFGCAQDSAALAAMRGFFPDREVIGLPADAVLAGGGGFHCASQQMPAA